MKKVLIWSAFVLLFVGFAQAQKTQTLTGIVVEEVSQNKWAAIVIRVGRKKYGVQTGFNASAGDNADGVRGFVTRTVGNISKGKTVQVFYTKIDNTFNYNGVNTWLNATKIVEVKKKTVSAKSKTAEISEKDLREQMLSDGLRQALEGCEDLSTSITKTKVDLNTDGQLEIIGAASSACWEAKGGPKFGFTRRRMQI